MTIQSNTVKRINELTVCECGHAFVAHDFDGDTSCQIRSEGHKCTEFKPHKHQIGINLAGVKGCLIAGCQWRSNTVKRKKI